MRTTKEIRKLNIRMVVQNPLELSIDFAARLEEICFKLSIEYEKKMHREPIVIPTSASDGRLTATIQFITYEKATKDKLQSKKQ